MERYTVSKRASKSLSRRMRIKRGIRKRIQGTPERPRLSVYRSNTAIYAQIIDDTKGVTIVSASSRSKDIAAQQGTKTDKSRLVGMRLAEMAKSAGLNKIVFDRNGFIYHGRIKALADAAREGGLDF